MSFSDAMIVLVADVKNLNGNTTETLAILRNLKHYEAN